MPGSGPESTGNAAACGLSLPASFARYDPDTSSWRTSQLCLTGEWEEFSETWPQAGTMRNGACYRQRTSGRRTSDGECSLWPTPRAEERCQQNSQDNGVALSRAVRETFPTPVDMSRGGAVCRGGSRKDELLLAGYVQKFPTPSARDWKSGKSKTDYGNSRPLSEKVSGQLSPGFVEWLMGFPRNHTEIEDEPMDSAEASTKTDTGDGHVRTLREPQAQAPGAPPPGLQQAPGRGDSLSEMPREGGSGNRVAPPEATENMHDLRGDVLAESQQEPQDLLGILLESIGKAERRKAMEGAFTDQELRMVWETVLAAKGKGQDVLSFMWEQAGMGSPWKLGEWPGQPRVEEGVVNRVDRLRALGNAVVPQVAEWIGRKIMELEHAT